GRLGRARVLAARRAGEIEPRARDATRRRCGEAALGRGHEVGVLRAAGRVAELPLAVFVRGEKLVVARAGAGEACRRRRRRVGEVPDGVAEEVGLGPEVAAEQL